MFDETDGLPEVNVLMDNVVGSNPIHLLQALAVRAQALWAPERAASRKSGHVFFPAQPAPVEFLRRSRGALSI
jgi:hypothetical protein